MVNKALSLVMVAAFLVVGCATTPATTAPTATTQPKAAVETPKPAAATPKSATDQAKPTAQPAATGPSGTLVVAVGSFGNENLDPVVGGILSLSLYPTLYETLLAYDNKGNLIPRLAESWSLSQDGKAWTFKMRKGVKFHNGDEVTSADAKFSLERLMSTKSASPWAAQYRRSIDRIETPDPSTMVIYTKDVDVPFAVTALGMYVMPKKYIEEKGETYFAENPVGTGAYKFVSRTPGATIEYEAVANHWRSKPGFQKIIAKVVPEEATRMAMLKRGELDIVEVSLDNIEDTKKSGFELRFATYASQIKVNFSGTWAAAGMPAGDVKFREALSLAINRDELAKLFFKGYAEPTIRATMAPYGWAYDPNWKTPPYDPQKAKELLKQVGYPDKFKEPVITMYSAQMPNAGWMPQFVQIYSGYWEAIGVKTKVTPIDSATLSSMVAAQPIDPKIAGASRPYVGATGSNTTYNMLGYYGSTGIQALLKDTEWDALYNKMAGERDDAKRADLFRQLANRGFEQYVDIQGMNYKVVYAVSNKVGEWQWTAGIGGGYEYIMRK